MNQPNEPPQRPRREPKPVHERPANTLAELIDEKIMGLGEDIRAKQLKLYMAYQRIKNFACVVSQKEQVLIYLRLDPGQVALQDGFSRDVRTVGHWGTGDLELRLNSVDDVDRAMPLIQRSYEGA